MEQFLDLLITALLRLFLVRWQLSLEGFLVLAIAVFGVLDFDLSFI